MLYDTSRVSACSPACKTIRCTVPEPGSSSVDGIMCVDTCGESNGGLLGKLQSHLVGMYAGTYLLMLLCI